VGCIAGALSKAEYEQGLAAAGFEQITVAFTHQVADGLHSAIVKASKPTGPAADIEAARPTATTSASTTASAVGVATAGASLPLIDQQQPGCC